MGSLSNDLSPNTDVDLVLFAIDGPVSFDQQKPLYIDASDPTHNLNANQFRVFVRKLVAGFKAAGLRKVIVFYSISSTVYTNRTVARAFEELLAHGEHDWI